MKWSFKLIDLADIDVYVHTTFLLSSAGLAGATGRWRGA